MEKYKVLLVDDEAEVIEVIEQRIQWDDLGFTVVGNATNGVKALELVEKLQPDVVITDIKMPYMDGLELSRRLNRDFQNIHIIIFTGFDEFEYAKEAVHLEVEEYMLKPINATELSDCLKRLKDTLDREREEKLNVTRLENYFNAALPVLQNNFFVSLIEGRVTEETRASKSSIPSEFGSQILPSSTPVLSCKIMFSYGFPFLVIADCFCLHRYIPLILSPSCNSFK